MFFATIKHNFVSIKTKYNLYIHDDEDESKQDSEIQEKNEEDILGISDIEDENGAEFNYNVLVNGAPDVVIQGATALETEVEKLKTYTDDLKLFFLAFQQSIFISDTNGNEFNYSSLIG